MGCVRYASTTDGFTTESARGRERVEEERGGGGQEEEVQEEGQLAISDMQKAAGRREFMPGGKSILSGAKII